MAVLHFTEYPYQNEITRVNAAEVKGRFKGWKKKADYFVRATVVLQVDTTNVSDYEYGVAPNLVFLASNQAIVNIYKTWHARGVSFEEFNRKYSAWEASLERYSEHLTSKLNNARKRATLPGSWYVNPALNDRQVEVGKP